MSVNSGKVRLAIIGCGTISQLNAPGYLRHPNCEIAALCDARPERAQARASEWGITPRIRASYEDVLNDPAVDAVELLTPTHMHARQAADAIRAGKHVSCQKPVASTVAETEIIADALRGSGAGADSAPIFRVTENFLYYPPIVKAKELLDAGAIGDPSMVRIRTVRGKMAQRGIDTMPDAYEWRRDPNLHAGGMLYDDGWHKYATAIWWLGEIDKVQSFMTRADDYLDETPSAVIWKHKGKDCIGALDYASSPEMEIRGRYYPIDEFFEIQGGKGAIWVTRCTGEMLDMPPVMLVKGTEITGVQTPMDWIEGFNGAARAFIDAITRRERPDMDLAFSRHTLQTALAVYQAAAAERAIPVDSVA